jgi:ubiquitin-protein ligase
MPGLAPNKRIAKELADAQGEAMTRDGIFYWFDEADFMSGKAMIFGPKDTPYADCPLLFSFKLPTDYPFNPPSATFLTSDGMTRFHPNLYVAGKVCLSILGTWTGPKWSAVMNLSTVLSSIQSLLEANPIVNEPSWEKYTLANPKAADYAAFVRARLVAHSFADLCRWRRGQCPAAWVEFKDVLEEHGERLWQSLWATIQAEAAKGMETSYSGLPYGMAGRTAWASLQALGEKTLKECAAAAAAAPA